MIFMIRACCSSSITVFETPTDLQRVHRTKVSADDAYERAVVDLKKTMAKLNEQRALQPIDAKPASKLPRHEQYCAR